jgi:phenylalanyl-tRNA synthetase beta chain
MRVSYNWLKEMVEIDLPAEEVAERLTMAGLEVEKIERPGERLDNVLVGKVLSVEKHPNADRLSLCRVDSGQETLQIICGAPNVKAGAKIALGLIGAVLAEGTPLRKVRIRGVESHGMICSEVELGLGDDAAGIIILPDELEVGRSLASALGLDDSVFVIDITPNRPDCLSMRGVAREVAAIFDKELAPPPSAIVEGDEPASDYASVLTENLELCPRYCARVVAGVKVGPSPEWLKQKIEVCGVRSINNIVDVTNYVLLELGQPLHAFDLDRLEERRIVVRNAAKGETILTLDGQERRLNPEMLVIADGRRAVAIAGVMGGSNSEVDDNTTTVLIESAYFNPSSVRRTSKELALSTEASYRFERGVDPEIQAAAASRAAELIRECAGGEIKKGVIEVAGGLPCTPDVRVRNSRVNFVLGTSLSDAEIENVYSRLDVEIVEKSGDGLLLRPPSFRRDLAAEIDFIEEVVRIYGYDRVPRPVTRAKVGTARRNSWQDFEGVAKNVLTGLGFFEIISADLISERQSREIVDLFFDTPTEVLRVLKPVSAERNVLRPALFHGLLECMARNQTQKRENVRLFELGRVHFRDEGGDAIEKASLCLGMSGGLQETSWDSSEKEVDFYDMKGAVEVCLSRLGVATVTFRPVQNRLFQSGKAATILAKGQVIGTIGELSGDACRVFDLKPRVLACELDADELVKRMDFSAEFKKPPVFPGSARDISVVVDEAITYDDLLAALKKKRPRILEAIEVFDVYRGEQIGANKKSVALSLKYRSKHGTLTDEEVEAAHSAMKLALMEELACEIREGKKE